jgi:hypothetical protein
MKKENILDFRNMTAEELFQLSNNEELKELKKKFFDFENFFYHEAAVKIQEEYKKIEAINILHKQRQEAFDKKDEAIQIKVEEKLNELTEELKKKINDKGKTNLEGVILHCIEKWNTNSLDIEKNSETAKSFGLEVSEIAYWLILNLQLKDKKTWPHTNFPYDNLYSILLLSKF